MTWSSLQLGLVCRFGKNCQRDTFERVNSHMPSSIRSNPKRVEKRFSSYQTDETSQKPHKCMFLIDGPLDLLKPHLTGYLRVNPRSEHHEYLCLTRFWHCTVEKLFVMATQTSYRGIAFGVVEEVGWFKNDVWDQNRWLFVWIAVLEHWLCGKIDKSRSVKIPTVPWCQCINTRDMDCLHGLPWPQPPVSGHPPYT